MYKRQRLTGNNKKVAQYVMKQDVTKEFVNRIQEIITRLVPCYVKEGKYSLTVAFGCTGGQHRSVTLANEFYKIFTSQGWRVTLEPVSYTHLKETADGDLKTTPALLRIFFSPRGLWG